MRTLKMLALVVLVGGLVAASAQASLIISAPLSATQPTDAGKVAYDMWVTGTGGQDMLSAIDIRITGTLWQVWKWDSDAELYSTKTPEYQSLTVAAGKYTNDSHFLWPDATGYYPNGISVLRAGDEDRAGPYTVDRSKGTFLDEAVILLNNPSNPSPIARIVLDTGGSALATGSMSDKDGVVTNFSDVLLPEPATLALLGLGGVALVLRRRRTR